MSVISERGFHCFGIMVWMVLAVLSCLVRLHTGLGRLSRLLITLVRTIYGATIQVDHIWHSQSHASCWLFCQIKIVISHFHVRDLSSSCTEDNLSYMNIIVFSRDYPLSIFSALGFSSWDPSWGRRCREDRSIECWVLYWLNYGHDVTPLGFL